MRYLCLCMTLFLGKLDLSCDSQRICVTIEVFFLKSNVAYSEQEVLYNFLRTIRRDTLTYLH